ncbi:NADPH:quinone oxidoreductase family protein [Roseovarius atlanticus]|uniref:NADPH:quinone oxidoreductase family protein n=1 Tax=Roseovarius atlanticus TaxID=1641875 RepID=UPI001C95194A|nr:NADPH:quinone oxidoreductase family protein [Roseovarius atlanticus]MBY5988099.1 NADPH:quinone oxidoreductase family protein [Roseovarius atlanticus]MBY6123490.1 NADPH:quinone oxidoreductase family protein [Roseovarius atlanticus]MBY6147985.1 NADPH:quinone oxidoreductase family protein [Roseovarius atlanticus]
MRAFRIDSHDTTATLQDVEAPRPAAGEIGLQIHACGLNFADLLMLKGEYQDTPDTPFTLGMEVAGTVEALGDGVEGPAIGSRVAVFGGQGGLAERGCFPADRAVILPDQMSFTDAAAFQIAYGTSHVGLDHKARLQPGETLLVLGAAGGVGLTAVEIGKLMGATVIACARGADKLEVARKAGADHLIDAETDDIREACRALGGVDVVYDPVGGDQFKSAMRACRPEARILTIGFASGEVPKIPANHLLVKNISVLGLYWGGYLAFRPQVVTDSLAQLFAWYADGRLKPHVSHILPLEKAQEGLDLMRTRKSTGKVVITTG